MRRLAVVIMAVAGLILAGAVPAQAETDAYGQYAWHDPSGNVYPESNGEMVYALSLTQPTLGSAAYTAVQRGGDFLVWAQNDDGGFDWKWNILQDPKPGNSSWNLFGVTSQGLIGAYNVTGDVKYLNAAKKTADTLKDSINNKTWPTNGWPLYQDCWFLAEYAEVSGDHAYLTAAEVGLGVSVTKYSTYGDRGGVDNDPATIAHGMVQRFQIIDDLAPAWGDNRTSNGYDIAPGLMAFDMAGLGAKVNVAEGSGDPAVWVNLNAVADALEAEMQTWIDSDAAAHLTDEGKWYMAADTSYGTDLLLNQGAALISLVRSMEGGKAGTDYTNYIQLLAQELALCNTGGYFWSNPATHGEVADMEGGVQAHAYALMGLADYNDLGSYPELEAAAATWAAENQGYIPVPEPGALSLVGLGLVGLARRKRRS